KNLPSHPGLLDELSRAFVRSGYDQRLLIEGILNSKTYQLSSVRSDASQADPRRYGCRAVRGLMPEQIFDSLVVVSEGGVARAPAAPQPGMPQQDARSEFLQRFPAPDRPTEAPTSIRQSLYLMNGPLVRAATRPATNRLLKLLGDRVADDPERCVEELYLLTLSRRPDARERARLVKYLKSGDPRKALG